MGHIHARRGENERTHGSDVEASRAPSGACRRREAEMRNGFALEYGNRFRFCQAGRVGDAFPTLVRLICRRCSY